MRGMILAAGRGARMGALTQHTAKPLLQLRGKYLIEYSIYALKNMGIHEIVINISYLASQIKQAIGGGQRYGVSISYSEEPEALETGGGILQALPLLGSDPFVVTSCDIVTDFEFSKLVNRPAGLAHLVLVDNPSFHPTGDFVINGNQLSCQGQSKKTFANIGVYHPELFKNCQPGKFALGPLLKSAAEQNLVTGEHYAGRWFNIGTPEEYQKIQDLERSF